MNAPFLNCQKKQYLFSCYMSTICYKMSASVMLDQSINIYRPYVVNKWIMWIRECVTLNYSRGAISILNTNVVYIDSLRRAVFKAFRTGRFASRGSCGRRAARVWGAVLAELYAERAGGALARENEDPRAKRGTRRDMRVAPHASAWWWCPQSIMSQNLSPWTPLTLHSSPDALAYHTRQNITSHCNNKVVFTVHHPKMYFRYT